MNAHKYIQKCKDILCKSRKDKTRKVSITVEQTQTAIPARSQASLTILFLIGLLLPDTPVFADATAACNVGTGAYSTECGVDSMTTGVGITALGYVQDTRANHTVSMGAVNYINNDYSVLMGTDIYDYAGSKDVSIGQYTGTAATGQVFIGHFANTLGGRGDTWTRSTSQILIGYAAGGPSVNPGSIAIGAGAYIKASGSGGIAIGQNAFAGNNIMRVLVPYRIQGQKNQLMHLEHSANTTEVRVLANLVNNGPVGFEMEDTHLGNAWQFRSNPNSKFIINRVQNPGNEFYVDAQGNAQFAGEVTANGILLTSSRASKTDISAISPEDVMNKLKQLEVSAWRYKHADENDRHISPMAEDFYSLFKLGRDGKGINPNDLASVAIVAAKALKHKNTLLKAQIEERVKRLDSLEKRIKTLVMANAGFKQKGKLLALND